MEGCKAMLLVKSNALHMPGKYCAIECHAWPHFEVEMFGGP